MLLIAVFLGTQAGSLEFGDPSRMGPGFFPLVLSGVLACLSLGLIVRGARNSAAPPLGTVGLRGVLLVLLPPIVFGVTVRGLGFAPATALAVLLAAAASRRATPLSILLTVLGLSAVCLFIFSYALGVSYPLIGDWLEF